MEEEKKNEEPEKLDKLLKLDGSAGLFKKKYLRFYLKVKSS